MATAKDITVKPISAKAARALVQRVHYSGKTVQNSQLHLGVYLGGKLEGAMQFGPPLDKRKIQGLVSGTAWNGFIELNRMAFSDRLPRNSESRAIAIAMKLIRKHYPGIEWVISFADGTQCGDGTIYRASGFELTAINKSLNLVRLPCGEVVHKMTLESSPTSPRRELGGKSYYGITGGKYNLAKYAEVTGGKVIPGFQLRYIYFINPDARGRLIAPILPFSKIEEMGAGMYKGEKVSRGKQATSEHPSVSGGAAPTPTLHTIETEDGGSS